MNLKTIVWERLAGRPMKKTSDEFERLVWSKGELAMGLDEAGRGPLCGPLVVACCVFRKDYENELIYDSKKLSLKKRQKVLKMITKDALYYSFMIVSNKKIDELNIYQATKWAMEKLALKYQKARYVLSDAMPLDLRGQENIAIIKGDQKSVSIAAASIIAKVVRDHIMDYYDRLYPAYKLSKHKGYPTKEHLALLKEYGLKDFYRLTYAPCQKILGKAKQNDNNLM